MAMTPLKKEFVSSEINKFFDLNGRVTVNATLLLLENTYTSSVNVKRDIQRKVIEVIQVNILTYLNISYAAPLYKKK